MLDLLTSSSIGLLGDIMLGTALQGLAGVVLLLVLSLLGTVANHTGSGTANSARSPVTDTREVVASLAGSLLLLTLEVLLASGLLKVLL